MIMNGMVGTEADMIVLRKYLVRVKGLLQIMERPLHKRGCFLFVLGILSLQFDDCIIHGLKISNVSIIIDPLRQKKKKFW